MPKSVHDRGVLKPADIAMLQRIFDEACKVGNVDPRSGDAREIALTILALHNAGMADEQTLRDAVCFHRPDAKSA